MAVFFSASELLDMAVAIEKNGEAYYQRLEGKTKNDNARVIYGYLAGEERKHRDLFLSMKENVATYRPPESYTGEYMQYMDALAQSRIFDSIEAAVKSAEELSDELQAVETGIKAEKDSILFYAELQSVVSEADREIIHSIVNEEKGHLRQLTDLKTFIVKGGGNGSRA